MHLIFEWKIEISHDYCHKVIDLLFDLKENKNLSSFPILKKLFKLYYQTIEKVIANTNLHRRNLSETQKYKINVNVG